MSIVIATAGPVTLTGVVTETNFVALRIPANTIGRNGLVEVRALWSYTNSAGSKTLTHRLSTGAGVGGSFIASNAVLTTTATAQTLAMFGNNNVATSQSVYNISPLSPYGTSANNLIADALDTTQDVYVNITGAIAAAGDTLTLQHAAVVIFPVP